MSGGRSISPADFMVLAGAQTQANADDDIHQEVGDVCREVARELGGKASCGWFVIRGAGRHGSASGRDGAGSPKEYSPAGFLSYRLVTAV